MSHGVSTCSECRGWQEQAYQAEVRIAELEAELGRVCADDGWDTASQAELERYAPVVEAARAQLAAYDRYCNCTVVPKQDASCEYERWRSAWVDACVTTDRAARAAGLGSAE